MEIYGVSVMGMSESIIASGFPMLSKEPTEDEFWGQVSDVEDLIYDYENEDLKDFNKENSHFKRILKLANAPLGSGHNNALKGIIVQMNVKAPRYFWNQLQRYNFVDFVSSMSQMHRIKSLSIEDNDLILEETLALADDLRKKYEAGEIDIDTCLANMPQGLELTARLSTNYLQLKTIYAQRRNHRSKEWQVFCDWIEELPFAKELILS